MDAGLRLLRAIDRVMPVKVAFWARRPDALGPELFVASDSIHRDNHRWAYQQLVPLIYEAEDDGFEGDGVRVVDGDDPRVAAAIAMRDPTPGRRPRSLGRGPLGNAYVEELYIYSPLHEPAVAAG